MTTLKLSQPRPPKTSLTRDGITKRRTRPKPPPRYDLTTAPNGLRPRTQVDIQNFALDLLDREDRNICTTRPNLYTSIWLYKIGGISAALGSKIPDWNDMKPPLDGSWQHTNLGPARLYKNYRIKGVSSPDMHKFVKPAPTNLPVFITPAGQDLGGYVKFFILPVRTGYLYLASFHENRQSPPVSAVGGKI